MSQPAQSASNLALNFGLVQVGPQFCVVANIGTDAGVTVMLTWTSHIAREFAKQLKALADEADTKIVTPGPFLT